MDPRARALRPPTRRAAGAELRLQGLARETQPYDDVRVRKAVNFAINRQATIDTVNGGNGVYSGTSRPATALGR